MRTFIAIDIPAEAKMQLDRMITGFKGLGGRVSWTKAKNLHLTVKFIGDFSEDKLEDLSTLLKDELRSIEPQQLSLSGLGAFPNIKKPRVLWVGVGQGKEWFVDLALKIDSICKKLRIPREKKKPSPHLTLGRVRDLKGCEKLLEDFSQAKFDYPEFAIGNITIYRSDLSPQGAKYTVLEKISFK
ncbi:MAG: RNA 2',3'-cyclic phosphodiesterase [candidate division Zixibacteria bacterium]|nr:RNA 2',3'-cyclic phosphodiesterase [candidate division Zixibacteria bacterium]